MTTCLTFENVQQTAIDDLQNSQTQWNGKLEQTLEVANEAFGELTPFAMKGHVEQMELEHQLLVDELNAVRDTLTDLSAASAAASSASAAAAAAAHAAPASLPSAAAAVEGRNTTVPSTVACIATVDDAAGNESGVGAGAGVDFGLLREALEREIKDREELQERLAALEPMRDEFMAEKMHTDSEIEALKEAVAQCDKKKLQVEVGSDWEGKVAASIAKDGSVAQIAKTVDALQEEMIRLQKAMEEQAQKMQEEVATAREQQDDASKEKDGAMTHVEKTVDILQDEIKALKAAMAQQLQKLQDAVGSARETQEAMSMAKEGSLAQIAQTVDTLQTDMTRLKQAVHEQAKKLQEEVVTAREHEDNESRAKDGGMMHVEKMLDALQNEVKALKEDVHAHKKASSLTEASKRADDTHGSAAGWKVEELQKCVDALRVDHDGLAKQLREEVVTAREHEDDESKAKDGGMMHVEKMVDALQDEVNTLKGALNDSTAQTQLGKNEVKKKADALQDQINVLMEAAAVQNTRANNGGMMHVEKMVDGLQDEVKALKEAVALQEIAHTKRGEAAKKYQDIVHKHRGTCLCDSRDMCVYVYVCMYTYIYVHM